MRRNGANYYYHSNGLGSVTALTDTNKAIVQSYVYDSFGQIISQSGSITNPYTFTGREYDSETGLYYYRARYYDAKIGKFISEDPIGLAGGDINLYVMVSNSPINLIDPWGLIRGEIIYFSRKPGSDFPYHVGFDQGNNQILMLNEGYIRSRDFNQYLNETGYGVVGYADISDYISADQFEKNILTARKSLEDNFKDWDSAGTMCVDVMNVGFGNAYKKLQGDIIRKIGDSSNPYYWRRNTTYLNFFKRIGKFRK